MMKTTKKTKMKKEEEEKAKKERNGRLATLPLSTGAASALAHIPPPPRDHQHASSIGPLHLNSFLSQMRD
ncbi:unnamed protein product [Nippostrongylus brasiliensis]|uniref:Uncharacterized protein n=1 Tax=Nippostrongylus brasiliensis TaxID=27835 RepID=A0A0N4Y2P9_NIPBR|nr:unnamed protein product [Nippostrongylus brasiliensis]